jgi:nitrate reductase gamma subunit
MLETFLFVGLPYLALFAMIVGSIYRYRFNRFSYSALSSQMLESQKLLWGSVPFHLGIAVIVIGHLIPFLFPGIWHSLTANQAFLISVEILGLCAAFLCAFGLCVLLIRRIQTVRLQSVTTAMDLTVVGLLLLQVLIGIALSSRYRWGASWSTGTTTPYLWSVLTLHPDISYIVDMPALIKVHLVAAYVLFLLDQHSAHRCYGRARKGFTGQATLAQRFIGHRRGAVAFVTGRF